MRSLCTKRSKRHHLIFGIMITARLLDHGDYTRLERTQAPNSDVTVVENYLTKSWANQSLPSTNWICFEVAVQFGSNRTKPNDSKKGISGFTMNIMIWGDIIWLDAKVAQTRRKSMTLPVDTTPRLGRFVGSVDSAGPRIKGLIKDSEWNSGCFVALGKLMI